MYTSDKIRISNTCQYKKMYLCHFYSINQLWQELAALRLNRLMLMHKRWPKKSHPVLPGWLCRSGLHLLEQSQYRLGGLVSLSEHGCSCLLDDLRLGQIGGLFGVVSIQNTAARGLQVGHRCGQAVLVCTHRSA